MPPIFVEYLVFEHLVLEQCHAMHLRHALDISGHNQAFLRARPRENRSPKFRSKIDILYIFCTRQATYTMNINGVYLG